MLAFVFIDGEVAQITDIGHSVNMNYLMRVLCLIRLYAFTALLADT
jgi:hypothetical protein